jgi:uncharacterized protein (TIGR01319 family)
MAFLSDLFEGEEPAREPEEVLSPHPEAAGPILAVDIGTVYTRAILLDVVDGSYRFVGRGEAPTTDIPPWDSVLFGVTEAINQITDATGHRLIDEDGGLIMPERAPFMGVGVLAATASAGKPVRAVLVGLMPSVSIDSGRRIAASSYLSLVDVFSLADRRSQEKQIDALLAAEPDLILVVGGTDGGAKESVRKQIDTIGLACSLIDFEDRPTILYAGNEEIRDEIPEKLEKWAELDVLTADNVRPTLDTENLEGVQGQMATLFNVEKSQSTRGFDEVGDWTPQGILPTTHAFSRAIQIMGHLEGQDVLGIDLSSSAATVAASIEDAIYLNVFDELGSGRSITGVLDQLHSPNLVRWLSYEPHSLDEVLDYAWNRWIFPHTAPTTKEELEIEYAVARLMIHRAVTQARSTWRGTRQHGLLPPFGTVLLSGAVLTNVPHYGWSALVALDTLRPTAMTRLLLDPYAMAPALGAIAPLSPTAVVQVLDTGAFIDLGTVFSVTGRARRGEIVVRGALRSRESGEQSPFEVPFGSIVTLPLALGEQAELTLQTHRVEVDMGGKRRGKITVVGGELGVIIDARGRPWRFRDNEERRGCLKEWQEAITQELPR